MHIKHMNKISEQDNKQWCSQGKNLKAKAKASSLKAKAWTFEAKAKAIVPRPIAFKHTATTEIKICSTSDSLIR